MQTIDMDKDVLFRHSPHPVCVGLRLFAAQKKSVITQAAILDGGEGLRNTRKARKVKNIGISRFPAPECRTLAAPRQDQKKS
jgi:hypothetical protein